MGDARLTNSFVKGETLDLLHRIYVALPYPLRRAATVVLLMALLLAKPLLNRNRPVPTPRDRLYTLSYWGVPKVDPSAFRLRVAGQVRRPLDLSLPEIEERADVDRWVTLDCVGGTRNVVRMEGLSLDRLLTEAGVQAEARTARFRCADGYHEAAPLADLRAHGAFLAFRVNGEAIPTMGHPLRLAFPGKYGYKWAKWVQEIEIVEGQPRGVWEALGLPERANVGDIF